MGTRGLMGVAIDGAVFGCYNHFDSYPGGLGASLSAQLTQSIATSGLEALKALARGVCLVPWKECDDPASGEALRRLRAAGRIHDKDQSIPSPYELRGDGNLIDMLQVGVLVNNTAFAGDSLFCEWAYIADLDRELLEVYRGFVCAPHNDGRFAALPYEPPEHRANKDREYWPVRLVAEIPFARLDQDWTDLDTLLDYVEGTSDRDETMDAMDGPSAHEFLERLAVFDPLWAGAPRRHADALRQAGGGATT